MSDSKAKEAAEEKRMSTATAPPAYEERSDAGSEDLYFVTPQLTGQQDEKAPAKHEAEPKDLDGLKSDWERIDGPAPKEDLAGTGEKIKSTPNNTTENPFEAPPIPPKTPIDDEPVTVEKNVRFEDFDQAPPLPVRPSMSTTESDEQLARQLQAEEDQMAAPELPSRHVSFEPSLGEVQSAYTLSWRRPLTDYSTLTITPNADSSSYWRLNYESKYFARLYRYQATQARVDGDFPARQVAEMRFPQFIWPGCGPNIKFEAFDEAAGHKREGTFMKCTGWLMPRYTLDMPVLAGSRCTWRTSRSSKKDMAVSEHGEAAEVWWQPDGEAQGPSQRRDATGEGQVTTVGDLIAQAKAYINDENWTPYPRQHLAMGTDGNSGRVIATYARAAPWNRNAGVLSIMAPLEGYASEEYREGIIVACAAMAGMQDRMGIANSLLEASTESIMATKRKGNMPTPNTIRPYIRVRKRQTTQADASNEKAVGPIAKEERETGFQRSLKRLSAQLVPKSAGQVPQKKETMPEKAQVEAMA